MRAAFALFFITLLSARSAFAERPPVGAGRPIAPVSAAGLAHVGSTTASARRSATRTADPAATAPAVKATAKRPPPRNVPRASVMHLAFGFEMRGCLPTHAPTTSAVTLRMEVPVAVRAARSAAAPPSARPLAHQATQRRPTQRRLAGRR
jgi:hypothetical protein